MNDKDDEVYLGDFIFVTRVDHAIVLIHRELGKEKSRIKLEPETIDALFDFLNVETVFE